MTDTIDYFTSRAGEQVKEPTENDVLLLQKGHNNKGNQRLLEDAEEFRERYKQAVTVADKKDIAHQLLIRVKQRSGQFLKYNTIERAWCIQNYEDANLRVRQLLREMHKGNNHSNNKGTSIITPQIASRRSSEYGDACKLLSDETMQQACDILLSHHASDESLLQLYQKCVQAAHVIETEAPTSSAAPPRGRVASITATTTATSTTTSTTTSKTKTVIPPVNRTRVLHPSEFPHRGSMGNSNSNSNNNKPSGLPPTKKLRPSVPENALQFLAKLNKDITDDAEKKEDADNSNNTTDSNNEQQPMDVSIQQETETTPAVRVQPSRRSKKS